MLRINLIIHALYMYVLLHVEPLCEGSGAPCGRMMHQSFWAGASCDRMVHQCPRTKASPTLSLSGCEQQLRIESQLALVLREAIPRCTCDNLGIGMLVISFRKLYGGRIFFKENKWVVGLFVLLECC